MAKSACVAMKSGSRWGCWGQGVYCMSFAGTATVSHMLRCPRIGSVPVLAVVGSFGENWWSETDSELTRGMQRVGRKESAQNRKCTAQRAHGTASASPGHLLSNQCRRWRQ